MSDVYANYTTVDNGYDAVFKYYVEYVKELIPSTLDKFMYEAAEPGSGNSPNGPGSAYFECILNKDGKNSTTKACPIMNVRGEYSVYYTLTNSSGFFKDLGSSGIDQSWVDFGDHKNEKCFDTNSDPNSHKQHCVNVGTYYGYPIPASNLVVGNLKDIINSASSNIQSLQVKIDATYGDTIMGYWAGSGLEAVEVLAMPVAMMKQAVEAMKNVKDIAKEVEKQDKINLIVTVLTAIFAILPFIGAEGAAAAGLVNIGRIAILAGEAVNAGLAMYTVALDPTSAPWAVLGMLVVLAHFPEMLEVLIRWQMRDVE